MARRSLDCARDDTKGNHLAKCRGVLTEVVGGGDFGSAEVGLGDEAIDEGGFAYQGRSSSTPSPLAAEICLQV